MGSEMCIRDSLFADPTILDFGDMIAVPERPDLRSEPLSSDEFKTCLLYTSDAADDLLCVDLGGRRIIKKKNNKQKIIDTHK